MAAARAQSRSTRACARRPAAVAGHRPRIDAHGARAVPARVRPAAVAGGRSAGASLGAVCREAHRLALPGSELRAQPAVRPLRRAQARRTVATAWRPRDAHLPAGRCVMTAVSLVLEPIAVNRQDAAAALGMSLDSFERNVQPHVRIIRRGRLRLVPVAELRRWADANAERLLDDGREAA